MKLFLFVFTSLILSTLVLAEQNQKESTERKIIYPDDVPALSFELKLIPDMPWEREEYVEVSSDYYPGLNIELPKLEQLLSFRKFDLKLPPPGPSYYQPGGPVLYYYGIYMPSGQLITTSLPLNSDSNEKQ